MRTLARIILYLVVVAAVGLVGLAVFSDLPHDRHQREIENCPEDRPHHFLL